MRSFAPRVAAAYVRLRCRKPVAGSKQCSPRAVSLPWVAAVKSKVPRIHASPGTHGVTPQMESLVSSLTSYSSYWLRDDGRMKL